MKYLTRSVLIVASLALTGSAAMAATAHAHKVVWPDVDASKVTALAVPYDQRPVGLFGFAYDRTARGGADAPSFSPSYDTGPAIDNSADVAAQQATDAANQQMMLNSMQAVQEQNDEANAEVTAGILAAQQTEINANNYANNPNN
jgi:hypothetical protein